MVQNLRRALRRRHFWCYECDKSVLLNPDSITELKAEAEEIPFGIKTNRTYVAGNDHYILALYWWMGTAKSSEKKSQNAAHWPPTVWDASSLSVTLIFLLLPLSVSGEKIYTMSKTCPGSLRLLQISSCLQNTVTAEQPLSVRIKTKRT